MDSWGTEDSDVDVGAQRHERVELDPLAGPDGGEKSRRLARHWLEQIKKYDAEHKRWRKKCISIERRYRDQRNQSDEDGTKRANYLWANTQTIFPAIYGKCPTPIAERKFKDPDPIGRTAATIVERCLRNDLDGDGFHDAISDAVFDYLLPGRGVCWVRFEPEFGPSVSLPVYSANDLRDEAGQIEAEDDTDEEEKLEDTEEVLVRESAPVDYLHWDDWGYLPAKARRWSEVRVVFKRVYPSRDEMVGRWGEKIGRRIPLQRGEKERRDNSGDSRATRDDRDDKAEVFELWDKDTLSVYWVATGYDWLVNRADDPLELEEFFPVSKPLMMNTTNSTLIPTPLYQQYQDQAKTIDELTQRISQLTKTIKTAGAYNAACEVLARILDESVENELLPVDAWRKHMEDKGLAAQIDLLPIEQAIKAVEVLVVAKEKQVAEMDRITGLTDIMRGVTADGRETLGGQKLKNNNGKSRLRQYQDDVAAFARRVLRLKAEVICKHFRKKTLVEMSGALYDEGFGFSDIANFMASGMLDGAPSSPSLPQLPGAPPTSPGMPGAMPLPAMAGAPGAGPGAQPQAPGGLPQLAPWQRLIQAVLKINSAIDLLRDDITRGFRIDIETDSTIVADEQQDRADALEFIKSVEGYLTSSAQIAAANPDAVPLLGKLLQFGVRRFRVGRDLESSIDEFVEKAEEKAKQRANMPPPPNPEMIKAQAKVKEIQLKGQLDAQQSAVDLQQDQVRAAAEERSRQLELQIEQMKAHNEQIMARMDMMLEMLRLRADTHKINLEQHAAHMDHQRHQETSAMEHEQRRINAMQTRIPETVQ